MVNAYVAEVVRFVPYCYAAVDLIVKVTYLLADLLKALNVLMLLIQYHFDQILREDTLQLHRHRKRREAADVQHLLLYLAANDSIGYDINSINYKIY